MKQIRWDGNAVIRDMYENDYGYLTVEVAITRTGVMLYRRADGEIQKELKHPDEIFSDATMASTKGIPVTNEHPIPLVTSKNWKEYQLGTTHMDVRQEGDFLVISETIFDEDLAAYVISGKKEQVSIGFEADIVEEEGVFNDEEYTHIQKNIKINHIAHVERGRAGKEIKARVDSADSPILISVDSKDNPPEEVNKDPQPTKVDSNKGDDDIIDPKQKKEDDKMVMITIDGEEFEVAEEVVTKFEELQGRVDGLVEVSVAEDTFEVPQAIADHLEKLNGELDAKVDAVSALEGSLEQVKADMEEVRTDSKEGVLELIQLADEVRSFVGDSVAITKETTPTDLKIQLIQTLDEEFDSEGRGEEYISARYDGAKDILTKISTNQFKNFNRQPVKDTFSEQKKARLNLKKY